MDLDTEAARKMFHEITGAGTVLVDRPRRSLEDEKTMVFTRQAL
jgi:hypothetical protein